MDKLMLVASARSGTNLFSSVVSSYKSAVVLGEIFKNDISLELNYLKHSGLLDDVYLNDLFRNSNRALTIENLFNDIELFGPEKSLVFFKVFVEHIINKDYPVFFEEYFIRQKSKINAVFMYRDNLLSTYLSYRLAASSGVWINGVYSDSTENHFDRNDYLVWRNWITNAWNYCINFFLKSDNVSIRGVLEFSEFLINPIFEVSSLIDKLIIDDCTENRRVNITTKQSSKDLKNYFVNEHECLEFADDLLSNYCDFSGVLKKVIY